MELPLTVTDNAGRSRRDVLVRCDPTLAVQDLAVAVLSGNGQSSQTLSAPVYLADRPIAPDASVGRAGIGPGGILSVGGPVASAIRRPEGRYLLAVVGGMAAGMVVALPEATITVGRSERCDVSLDDVEVSRLHVSLTRAGDTVTIDDMHSANGTMVNGIAIQAPTVIRPNDLVAIGNSILTLRVPQDRAAECEPVGDGRLRFNKPPRQRQAGAVVTIQLPEEPKRAAGRHFSWLAMVAPLLLGLVFVAVMGNPAFLLFSLASPLMLGANALSDRRSGRRTFETRLAEYEKAKASLAENIATAVRREEKDRRDAAPDPATVADIAAPTQQLWERRREDADFLSVRVGLADLPSEIKLVAGREAPLVDQPVAHCVPVTVSLAGAGVVGVAGPRSSSVRLMRSVVLQLATLHSPLDLSVVFLSPTSPEGWDWLKWLPHLVPTPAQGGARLVGIAPEQRRARIDELVALVEARVGEQTRRYDRQPGMWPTTIVLLDDVTTLRAEPGVAYLLREGPAAGIVALCLSTDRSGLPAEAQVYIEFQATSAGSEVLKLTAGDATIENILPDGVDETHAAGVARSLAPLFEVAPRTAGAAGLPPPPVSHLDLLGMPSPTADSVLARWESVPAGEHSPAVVGLLEDGPFTVDLRHDGPHLLIAGTTGAGKSELLQTLVASLAVSNRPDDLTFLLVDFKGGSAFKDCDRLPHTLGVISNLDGRLVERALDSIQAELRWRQAMFSQAGVKDYDEYAGDAGRRGPRIPRLAVVVDELKELSDAYSDAVTRLNQAARLGRSLGVHLVLATQKPALIPGLADLRANTDLRLCLRVQDEADSRDVVGVPDAAAIRRADVGRGIARQSDGSQVNFQTGYLGSPLPSAGSPSRQRVEVLPFDLTTIGATGAVGLRPAGALGATDGPVATSLQVLVEAIRAGADHLALPPARMPWWPPLPATITLADLPVPTRASASVFPIGLIDMPDEQRQESLLLDFDDLSHVLVVGPVRSGRTTFLRTLAGSVAKYARPSDVHLYCLEFRRASLGDLERLPHCGAVLGVEDVERLERFFLFLETELERRAVVMSRHGSLAEQRGLAGTDGALPYVLVLCDNYEAFHERFSYEDGGRLVDRFAALLSDGPARGVHFVVTTDRRGLTTKLGNSIDARFLLRPSDREDQLVIGMRGRTMPVDLPAGRGYWYRGPAEAQVALLAQGQTGESQVAAISDLARQASRELASIGAGQLPRRVPPLPGQVTAAEVESGRRLPRAAGRAVVTLGVGGIDVAPADVDLDAAGSTFVVAGPRGSGRSSALMAVVGSLLARDQPMAVCVIAPRRSPLRALSGRSGVQVLTSMETLAGDLADVLASVSGPLALVVDDAELLLDTPVSARLDRLVRTAGDNDWIVVIGGTTSDLTRRFSGWMFEARQSRSGILLQPGSAADGEVFDLRLPRSTGSIPRPPGFGILAVRGRWMTMQVMLPAPAP